MYTWTDGTELYHHGIKGQKWGIRRFQNVDGSYTSEGKARRRGEFKNRLIRNSGSRQSNALREARSKDINKMSTREIQEMNSRLQAERQYAELTQGSISEGKKFAKQVMFSIISGVAVGMGQAWLRKKLGG